MAATRRIVVVGTSGSGKTTLARQISHQLDIPHIELDAIHHQPNWTPMPAPDFQAAVAERITGDAWVVDGNYRGKLGDLVWQRADTVVWFDLPRLLVMRQIVRRTVGRALIGRELWNGNRERWREMIALDPARSVIIWAWTTHAKNQANYLAAQSDPAFQNLTFVRLGSHREAAAFLTDLAGRAPSPPPN